MTPEIIDDAVALRKYLHQHPELSCEERETSAYLLDRVKQECTPDEVIVFDQYGIAAVYKGKSTGRRIMIRGDFDALPIQEINDFEHKSRIAGVSHKCGHDGHAATLYALGRDLSQNRPQKGDVILLFQPAEENGEGAKGIINDPKFGRIQPDFVVAYHNLPGYDLHTIVCREGPFTAAANSIIIRLHGKTSHAAEPELGFNPAKAMAEITLEILEQNEPDLAAPDFHIATPVYTTMGEKSYGVSAGYGELHFTLRAWENDVIRRFEDQCASIARDVAERHGLNARIEWTQNFFANVNDPYVVATIHRIAEELGLPFEERKTPFKWGEDFGIFTEKFPGAMFGIGSGKDCPALHNPDYDFPDAIIRTGATVFHQIISKLQE